ncbi:hypothetical protein [Paenibacillus silvae]|uniref:hypothetical protein n=1 Tax=Paenibacillus silvae TaxID=1325358 RepID=UPI0020055B44|nr:hypothetical protein [Paenibacillus silvae]MCK6073703.1 hypothetical protein [Paenibacillus silvae]MCK6148820.1 hypothetical protein [Paenibacillus silvae]MCK6267121.1 hypothetical protein [Paenibacillus silvae]
MKKILLSFLVVSFCFTSVISTASATQAEITNSTEITKQNQIDQLFTKLNEVVTERKHQEELNKVHYSYNDRKVKIAM